MRLLFRKKRSCEVARDRLKILLISDRIHCSPKTMELIKNDIIKVLSKYMLIDESNTQMCIQTMKTDPCDSRENPVFMATIPIVDLHQS